MLEKRGRKNEGDIDVNLFFVSISGAGRCRYKIPPGKAVSPDFITYYSFCCFPMHSLMVLRECGREKREGGVVLAFRSA